jgi:hypothetical protein
MSIDKLSKIFFEYKIYPQYSYKNNTPVKVFQKSYPENYYSKDINNFLKIHDYNPIIRGADLPWWGKNFFESNNKKVMIISQDSLSEDAGSVVFWSNLYDVINSKYDYDRYNKLLLNDNLFSYRSWYKVLEILKEWNINLESCYITDACKVYKVGPKETSKFDIKKSKDLLHKEINFCEPDLLILLGRKPLKLLIPDVNYSDAVEKGEYLTYGDIIVVVSPFITGQGHTQKNYSKRLNIASNLIKQYIK